MIVEFNQITIQAKRGVLIATCPDNPSECRYELIMDNHWASQNTERVCGRIFTPENLKLLPPQMKTPIHPPLCGVEPLTEETRPYFAPSPCDE